MALLHINWDPSVKKLRQFGAGLMVFAALVGGLLWWRGRPAGPWVLGGGGALGVLTLAVPAAGRWVYKAWMSIAFIVGNAVSFSLLGLVYYGMITPLAVFFRLRGRDELRLDRPASGSYWTPTKMLSEPSYYERLF